MSEKNSGTRTTTDWGPFWDKYRKLLMTASPMFLALAFLIALSYISTDPVHPLILSLSFFVSGFMGVIIIVRREIPAVLLAIHGVQAIAGGILVLLFFWGSAAYILIGHYFK